MTHSLELSKNLSIEFAWKTLKEISDTYSDPDRVWKDRKIESYASNMARIHPRYIKVITPMRMWFKASKMRFDRDYSGYTEDWFEFLFRKQYNGLTTYPDVIR